MKPRPVTCYKKSFIEEFHDYFSTKSISRLLILVIFIINLSTLSGQNNLEKQRIDTISIPILINNLANKTKKAEHKILSENTISELNSVAPCNIYSDYEDSSGNLGNTPGSNWYSLAGSPSYFTTDACTGSQSLRLRGVSSTGAFEEVAYGTLGTNNDETIMSADSCYQISFCVKNKAEVVGKLDVLIEDNLIYQTPTIIPDSDWVNISIMIDPSTDISRIQLRNSSLPSVTSRSVIIVDNFCIAPVDCITSQCCTSYNNFINKLNQGAQATVNGCNLTVSLPQLNGCYFIFYDGPSNWGDGTGENQETLQFPAGPWTHTYDSSGTYSVFFNVAEANQFGTCWQVVVRADFKIDCPNLCPDIDCGLLDVTVEKVDSIDQCCFESTITNNWCEEGLNYIKINGDSTLLSKIEVTNSWQKTISSPTEILLKYTAGDIPLGTLALFNACLPNTVMENLDFTWGYQDTSSSSELCVESIKIECISECPAVNCDLLKITQNVQQTDTVCCYTYEIENAWCDKELSGLSIFGDSMSLSTIELASDWMIEESTSEFIRIRPVTENTIPLGTFELFKKCIERGTDLDIKIGWFSIKDSTEEVVCIEDFSMVCTTQCPDFECDKVSILIDSVISENDCCFTATVRNDWCEKGLNQLLVKGDTSLFSNLALAVNWSMSQISENLISLNYQSESIPLGEYKLFEYCMDDNKTASFDISWIAKIDDTKQDTCVQSIVFDCPLVCPTFSCDSVAIQTSVASKDSKCCYETIITNNWCESGLTCIVVEGDTSILNSLILDSKWKIEEANSSSLRLCHSDGNIPLGEHPLFNFCVEEGITDSISLSWISTKDDGEMKVCENLIAINCESQCPNFSCDSLNFEMEMIDTSETCCYEMFAENLWCDKSISCIQLSAKSTFLDNIQIPGNWKADKVSDTVIMICDTSGLIPIGRHSLFTKCLSSGETEKIKISWINSQNELVCEQPFTFECDEVEVDSCCTNQAAFDDLLDLGFDITMNSQGLVEITVDQFDSCHYFTYQEPDWGDGSTMKPDGGNAAGMHSWQHQYQANGLYNLCLSVESRTKADSICYQGDICLTVLVSQITEVVDTSDCIQTSYNIPNGLTPNGDGINDMLIINRPFDCQSIDIQIFNRWGQLVYEKEDYQNNWEGISSNGRKLPDATYYIIVDFNGVNGTNILHTRHKQYLDLRTN